FLFFFFHGTPTTALYTLSLHDALPILSAPPRLADARGRSGILLRLRQRGLVAAVSHRPRAPHLPHDGLGAVREGKSDVQSRRGRSEEHTSELQSLAYLVCRLLLEKKKK